MRPFHTRLFVAHAVILAADSTVLARKFSAPDQPDSRFRVQFLPHARVIDRLWDMDDLHDAVMDRAERKRKAARIEKLSERLRKNS